MELIEELQKLLSDLQELKKKVEEIYISQLRTKIELDQLKKQLQEVHFIPEWVPTSRALELLDIKKADTLRNYAKMGLITQRRAHDKRNYYPREELFSLAQKLFDLKDKEFSE